MQLNVNKVLAQQQLLIETFLEDTKNLEEEKSQESTIPEVETPKFKTVELAAKKEVDVATNFQEPIMQRDSWMQDNRQKQVVGNAQKKNNQNLEEKKTATPTPTESQKKADSKRSSVPKLPRVKVPKLTKMTLLGDAEDADLIWPSPDDILNMDLQSGKVKISEITVHYSTSVTAIQIKLSNGVESPVLSNS